MGGAFSYSERQIRSRTSTFFWRSSAHSSTRVIDSATPSQLTLAMPKSFVPAWMMTPAQVSLPFKLLLFVAIDGWGLLAQALVTGYQTG